MLLAGLFGHRRPDDPRYVQWMHAAFQWAGAHWVVLAVVIPVAGALIAGIMNHFLAVARENRSRRIGRRELVARVHKDLAARLLVHCRELHAVLPGAREGDSAALLRGNARLKARSEASDVVEALGQGYVAFVTAVDDERRRLAGADAEHLAPAAARAILAYAPFLAEFGEQRQARSLIGSAQRAAKA